MTMPADSEVITKPGLVRYTFVRIGASVDTAGWAYLCTRWEACVRLGMTASMVDGVPNSFPSSPPAVGPARWLAAARRPGGPGVYGVYVFAEYEIAGLVVAMAPNTDESTDGAWAALVHEWTAAQAGDVEHPVHDGCERPDADDEPAAAVLGEVTVLIGLHRPGCDPAVLADAVRQRMAPVASPAPVSIAVTTSGLRVFGSRPGRRATVCVVAPDTAEAVLDAWVWARPGRYGLMPLTRFCLHATKLSYERSVYDRMRPTSVVATEIDTDLAGTLDLVDRWQHRQAVDLTPLLDADTRVERLRHHVHGVDWVATRLRELRETVQIATANAEAHAPDLAPTSDEDNLFARVRADGIRLDAQITRDLAYLDAVGQGATATHELTSRIIDRHLRLRQDRIVLLQTSIIGAVGMALTAVQGLQYHLPVAPSLQAPLIALLAAFAFALPVMLARWTGTMPVSAPYRRSDHLAAVSLGAAAAWFSVGLGWHTWVGGSAPPPVTLACAAVGALIVTGVPPLVRRRRTTP